MEDMREYENHDTGGKALARREFVTVDGVSFTVTAYSEWKNGTSLKIYNIEQECIKRKLF